MPPVPPRFLRLCFSSHKQTNKQTKKTQPLIAHALDIKGFAPSSCHLITAIQQPWEYFPVEALFYMCRGSFTRSYSCLLESWHALCLLPLDGVMGLVCYSQLLWHFPLAPPHTVRMFGLLELYFEAFSCEYDHVFSLLLCIVTASSNVN